MIIEFLLEADIAIILVSTAQNNQCIKVAFLGGAAYSATLDYLHLTTSPLYSSSSHHIYLFLISVGWGIYRQGESKVTSMRVREDDLLSKSSYECFSQSFKKRNPNLTHIAY